MCILPYDMQRKADAVHGEELVLVLCNAAPEPRHRLQCAIADVCREQQARVIECITCAARRLIGRTLLSLQPTDEKVSSAMLMDLQCIAAAIITFGQAFHRDILGPFSRPDQASAHTPPG